MKIHIVLSPLDDIEDAYIRKQDAENCAADLNDDWKRRRPNRQKEAYTVEPLEVKEAY